MKSGLKSFSSLTFFGLFNKTLLSDRFEVQGLTKQTEVKISRIKRRRAGCVREIVGIPFCIRKYVVIVGSLSAAGCRLLYGAVAHTVGSSSHAKRTDD